MLISMEETNTQDSAERKFPRLVPHPPILHPSSPGANFEPPFNTSNYIITDKPSFYTPDGSIVQGDFSPPHRYSFVDRSDPSRPHHFKYIEQEEEFLLFRLLPSELRLKIWFFALPGPRTLFLSSLSHLYLTCYQSTIKPIDESLRYNRSLGHLRLVCQESKILFDRMYRRIPIHNPGIGSRWKKAVMPGYHYDISNGVDIWCKHGYIDEKRDTLIVDPSISLHAKVKARLDLSRVSHLAIAHYRVTYGLTEDEPFANPQNTIENVNQWCPNLKTLTILWTNRGFNAEIPNIKSVLHFLEIGDDFTSLQLESIDYQVIFNGYNPLLGKKQRLRQLKSWADRTQEEFRAAIDSSGKNSRLKIKICMLAKIEGPCYYPQHEWPNTTTYLLPKAPRFSNVCYWTEEPRCDKSGSHFLNLRDLWAQAPCLFDGSIIPLGVDEDPYEGMAAMFADCNIGGDEERCSDRYPR
ncbi:hypothetical protein LZ554_004948 [Drepanopeziza brunnea f. sp. 'monogermtubi']|nr:hypothetical protein LZ554_004948 [Drepanopeziza brunnea f. sp. 'monogermtubi']